MSEVTLTNANFETEVLKSDVPVLVDFWAVWCGPCKMVAPAVAKIAEKYEGKLKVGKLNVDEQPELAEKFNISSIPTLAVFKGGKVVNQRIGAVSLSVLESFVGEYV
ncbi:thioredoxin [Pleomorphochaeta sp. DL1XJH-081]|jgi:thioredoxin 1|uniref:thioredoxin n=1 Tax=Pleomorphochaeta sp. DL1XJH-081 TaxID=3409690 RepID=UPI003BB5F0FA